jgi:antagonist of KipI
VITVLKPGLLSTIQDEGRPGHRAFGMPVSGALDAEAYAVANLLAGNAAGAAAVEMTLLGGAFRFDIDAFVAITGAEMQPALDGAPLRSWSSFPVRAGSVLSFSGAPTGCRCYLAIHGGIDVPPILGSRSTYTRARVGGLDGRALRAGDVLPVGIRGGGRAPALRTRTDGPACQLPEDLTPRYGGELRIRVVLGPQDDRFPADAVATFLGSAYTVSNRNDRMAYQLDGPTIRHARGADIVSDAMIPGSVQVPGRGLPIVMMADCPTVGGYTKIATAISADLPRLAQARAGDTVRFEQCTLEAAVDALAERRAWLHAVAQAAKGGEGR